jgi:hypothetical protein
MPHLSGNRGELLSNEPCHVLGHAAKYCDGNHANAQFSAGPNNFIGATMT